MTRDELIEAMARAAWECLDEPEPFDELPNQLRKDWIEYQSAALDELERVLPPAKALLGSCLYE